VASDCVIQAAVIDGVAVDDDAAVISVRDEGLLRGDGVFEVIRIHKGRAWALEEHLTRLERGAHGLRLSTSIPAFRRDIELLLSKLDGDDAFLRLVSTRGGRRISLIERIAPHPESIALATVEYTPCNLTLGIKTLSYAPNMLAVRLAKERSADDALLVTSEGVILEASRASFFCVIDDLLVTPRLDGVILDSITRRYLMVLVAASEAELTVRDLNGASEAFIASTTKQVLPVRAIDGRELETPGRRSLAAAAAYTECVRMRLDRT
jgi:branched-chain amino acid aminotransferase